MSLRALIPILRCAHSCKIFATLSVTKSLKSGCKSKVYGEESQDKTLEINQRTNREPKTKELGDRSSKNPNLLAPFGEDVEPEHPLLSLDDEFEEIDFLLGIGPLLL